MIFSLNYECEKVNLNIIVVENHSNIYIHLTHYTLSSKHPCSSSTCPVQTQIYNRLSIYLSIYLHIYLFVYLSIFSLSIYLFYGMFKDISSQLGHYPQVILARKHRRRKCLNVELSLTVGRTGIDTQSFKRIMCTENSKIRTKH